MIGVYYSAKGHSWYLHHTCKTWGQALSDGRDLFRELLADYWDKVDGIRVGVHKIPQAPAANLPK